MKTENFGTYFPQPIGKLLRLIIRTGISRGKIKKVFHFVWKKYVSEKPVDLQYNGVKLRIRPFGNTIESNILFSSKTREYLELKTIKKFVNRSTLFLDIGANFGYYSLFVASFGARRCISFEPNPILINRINENVVINNFTRKIEIAPYALGEKKGTVSLQISKYDLGSSAIDKNISSTENIIVRQKLLSEALQEFNEVHADIIKIDIEGLEDKVLFPYLNQLKKEYLPSLIIIEDNKNDWDFNILDWLETNNYRRLGKTRGNILLGKK